MEKMPSKDITKYWVYTFTNLEYNVEGASYAAGHDSGN